MTMLIFLFFILLQRIQVTIIDTSCFTIKYLSQHVYKSYDK